MSLVQVKHTNIPCRKSPCTRKEELPCGISPGYSASALPCCLLSSMRFGLRRRKTRRI